MLANRKIIIKRLIFFVISSGMSIVCNLEITRSNKQKTAVPYNRDITINRGARTAVEYASLATRNPNIDPVPVVRIILQPNAILPTSDENLFTLKSNIDHMYTANITKKPEYKKIFHAKIDLKL